MIVTPAQLCALYALRRSSPVYDVKPASDHALLVTSAAGREWIVTTTGRTLAVTGSVDADLCPASAQTGGDDA